MDAEELINYINDYNVGKDEKISELIKMNLPYSEILSLMDVFAGSKEYQMLHYVLSKSLCVSNLRENGNKKVKQRRKPKYGKY